jgi:outer membrane protein TolC
MTTRTFLLSRYPARLAFALAFVLSGWRLLGQQPGAAGQSAGAVQLPASGRMDTGGSVSNQQTTSQASGPSVVQPSLNVSGDYAGSIMGPPVPPAPLKLSLADAVERGLRFNLGVITAGTSSAEARAQRARALSQLLPQITASVGATETQINLSAYGFNSLGAAFHNFPIVVGPFHYVQGQGNVTWDAFNLTNLRNYQAEKETERASNLSVHDARELVVLAVAGSYLQVAATASRVESQRMQVKYAQAIYDQAQTQLRAGTTIRVDVSRSLVQLQTEQERLLALQSDYEQQKIAFARLIGIPQDHEIVFSETLAYTELPDLDQTGALRTAFEKRWDLRSLQTQVTAGRRALSAAHAERIPSVSFSGYYGANGPDPTNAHDIFQATGSVNIPVFDGGKIHADIAQSEATLHQRQAEYEDQKGRVEQDVRNAVIQLKAAIGQVKLAESNRKYALDTLTQTRDRFAAGVTNTVEVVQAQEQEARAENDYISSLFAFSLARLALARATGQAESGLANLFPGTHP